MDLSSKLAIGLAGLGLLLAALSHFSDAIEGFFRGRADRKLDAEEAGINGLKGKINEIHNENVTNINDYNKLKAEYDGSSGTDKK